MTKTKTLAGLLSLVAGTVLLAGCSQTNQPQASNTSSPVAEVQQTTPPATTETTPTDQQATAPAPAAAPATPAATNDPALKAPTLSTKTDVNSLSSDLNSTNISAESFN